MPQPQARAQQHPLQAKLPRVQSMLALQQQVSRGMWAERHLKALSEDEDNLRQLAGVLECTRETQRFLQRQPKKQQSAQTKCAPYITYSRFFSQPLTNTHLSSAVFHRNTVCVCAAVCPSATSEWLECFKGVVKKQRQGASGVELNACDDLKRRLEICTQHASSKLLHAAVMPSDRNDVVL